MMTSTTYSDLYEGKAKRDGSTGAEEYVAGLGDELALEHWRRSVPHEVPNAGEVVVDQREGNGELGHWPHI